MKFTTLATTALVVAAATAMPMASDTTLSRRDGAVTDPRSIEIVKKIAPSSESCDGVDFPDECATADQATQPLIDAFNKYKVNTPGEQAALLSWMAYESGEFRYNINHFPGRPGQGTRTMMMPNYVKMYADSIGITGADEAEILSNVNAAPGGQWGSASWFLTTQCSDDVRKGLQTGGKAEWETFITGCVETTLDSGEKSREVYWTRAAQALGMTV